VRFGDGVASDDLYGLLYVDPPAAPGEIRAGWVAQIGKWHPDRNSDPMATARTQAINGAYDVLKDPTLRKHYDQQGLKRSPVRSRERRPATNTEAQRAAQARWAQYQVEWKEQEAAWAAEQARWQRVQIYFQAEDRVHEAYAADPEGERDLPGALRLAVAAVEMLPEYGPELVAMAPPDRTSKAPPERFRSVWYGFLIAPILQDGDALNRIAAVLEETPALEPWRYLIDSARQSISEVAAILAYVNSCPGTIQSKLWKEVGQDPEQVRGHCYWLAAAGSIRREKAGSSYALFGL
jgi:curved DNA-binding protein CbpA